MIEYYRADKPTGALEEWIVYKKTYRNIYVVGKFRDCDDAQIYCDLMNSKDPCQCMSGVTDVMRGKPNKDIIKEMTDCLKVYEDRFAADKNDMYLYGQLATTDYWLSRLKNKPSQDYKDLTKALNKVLPQTKLPEKPLDDDGCLKKNSNIYRTVSQLIDCVKELMEKAND